MNNITVVTALEEFRRGAIAKIEATEDIDKATYSIVRSFKETMRVINSCDTDSEVIATLQKYKVLERLLSYRNGKIDKKEFIILINFAISVIIDVYRNRYNS